MLTARGADAVSGVVGEPDEPIVGPHFVGNAGWIDLAHPLGRELPTLRFVDLDRLGQTAKSEPDGTHERRPVFCDLIKGLPNQTPQTLLACDLSTSQMASKRLILAKKVKLTHGLAKWVEKNPMVEAWSTEAGSHEKVEFGQGGGS